MTLDQLVVLDAIARQGTFAAAAKTLARVPSAVSYAVKSLEEDLGLPLFDRSGHRAALTPAGRRVLEEGRVVLEQARRLEVVAASLRDGWEPELSVVVDGAYPTEPLMRALGAFKAHGAPTRVRLHVEYQSGVEARFRSDRADLMLMLAFEGTGNWQSLPLPDLDMLLVVAAEHPLASASVDREGLLDEVELVVRDSAADFVEAPREAWFGSRHVVYLSDFHGKLIAIRSGAGYGWLPGWLARPHVASGDLVMVPFEAGNTWTYHPTIVHRRDQPLGRAGALFLEALRGALTEA